MRRDLIIGLLCSIFVHAGLGLGGEIKFNWGAKKIVVKQEATLIQIEMPVIPPEPPEPVTDSESTGEAASIAPPSVADVPGVVDLNSFVQPVQPPPPPTAGITMTVPKNSGPIATGGLIEVFDLKNLDQMPVARLRAQPVYPFEMRRQGVSAEVVVGFICDSNGDVREARIVKSDNTAFDAAALTAIYKWKFRPGKKAGRSVNSRMEQPFAFNIADE